MLSPSWTKRRGLPPPWEDGPHTHVCSLGMQGKPCQFQGVWCEPNPGICLINWTISRIWVATASKCFRVPGAQSHERSSNQNKAVSPGKMVSQPSSLECSFPHDCSHHHSPKASGEDGQGSRTKSWLPPDWTWRDLKVAFRASHRLEHSTRSHI